MSSTGPCPPVVRWGRVFYMPQLRNPEGEAVPTVRHCPRIGVQRLASMETLQGKLTHLQAAVALEPTASVGNCGQV